ncbi:MAG TPA: hypothetical protein GX405_16425 [Rhizobiales bacterium]|nr:hypothetical protein [Hyphomicrobiales bacterium]
MRSPIPIASVLSLLAAGGCTTDDSLRIDGMTPGAGNAQAANTVMQMVDPWQPGVQDTKLKVPADRRATAPASAGDDTGTDKPVTSDN